jgi:hypothetical protein
MNILFLELHQKKLVFLYRTIQNIKEGNEDYFTYPENLYTLLLQRKDVNIEFTKPFFMNIKNYNYEWTRTFNFFFTEVLMQLSKEYNKTQVQK